jgi:hypothetical protein
LNLSEEKHKGELRKAQEKYDEEHQKRIDQEREIEDKWSEKVQKRNGKISGLKAEVKALKQQLSFRPIIRRIHRVESARRKFPSAAEI